MSDPVDEGEAVGAAPSAAPSADAVRARLVGLALADLGTVVDVTAVAVNPSTSRWASFLVDVVTDTVGPLRVLVKRGRWGARSRTGQPVGAAHEARVHAEALARVPGHDGLALGALEVGDLDGPGAVWLLLRWRDRAERVREGPVPDAMVATARWLGAFQRAAAPLVRHDPPSVLHRYDAATVDGWVALAHAALVRDVPTARGLADRLRGHAATVATLLSEAPTLVHGDLYPTNVLWVDGAPVPVDWEWAGIAAGELDLAALTDGWPDDVVAACVTAHREARADPDDHPDRAALRRAAAHAFLAARWLGGWPLNAHPSGTARYLALLPAVLDTLDGVGGADPHKVRP